MTWEGKSVLSAARRTGNGWPTTPSAWSQTGTKSAWVHSRRGTCCSGNTCWGCRRSRGSTKNRKLHLKLCSRKLGSQLPESNTFRHWSKQGSGSFWEKKRPEYRCSGWWSPLRGTTTWSTVSISCWYGNWKAYRITDSVTRRLKPQMVRTLLRMASNFESGLHPLAQSPRISNRWGRCSQAGRRDHWASRQRFPWRKYSKIGSAGSWRTRVPAWRCLHTGWGGSCRAVGWGPESRSVVHCGCGKC